MRKSNRSLLNAKNVLIAFLAVTAIGTLGDSAKDDFMGGDKVKASNEQSVYVNLKGGNVDDSTTYQLDGRCGSTVTLPVPTKKNKTLIGYTCSEGYISVTEYGEYCYTYGEDDGVLKAVWLEDIPKSANTPKPTKIVATATPKTRAKIKAVKTVEPTATPKVTTKPSKSINGVKISIPYDSVKMGVGETYTLMCNATNLSKVDVKVEDESILKYDKVKNTITAEKTGVCDLVLSAEGASNRKMTVNVLKAPEKVGIGSKDNQTATYKLRKGTTKSIPVFFEDGYYSNKVTFTSSNKKVATCNRMGKIKAVKKGKTKITIKTYNDKKAEVTVKVLG